MIQMWINGIEKNIETNPHIYSQLTFNKSAKKMGGKMMVSTNGDGITR